MNSVEKLSEVIAFEISKNITIDQEKREVIAYGAFVLIQTVLSIVTIAAFGVVFNVFFECIIISFAAAILRKFSGGAHANSAINCALIGMIIFGVLALFVKNYVIKLEFIYLLLIILISFVISFYIMYKYCPVGTVTKPLKNENTRKRLKRKSIIFVLVLFIANIIFVLIYLNIKYTFLINIAICISVGVVWQSITLVSLGHNIIYFLDKVLGGTINLIRRTNK